MKILAQYNNLFKKGELIYIYIKYPILKIEGLANVVSTCYLSRLPKNELTPCWNYNLPFPQIIIRFLNHKETRNVNYLCNEFKYIFKLIKSTK